MNLTALGFAIAFCVMLSLCVLRLGDGVVAVYTLEDGTSSAATTISGPNFKPIQNTLIATNFVAFVSYGIGAVVAAVAFYQAQSTPL